MVGRLLEDSEKKKCDRNYVATEKTMLRQKKTMFRHNLAAIGATRRKNMCRDRVGP